MKVSRLLCFTSLASALTGSALAQTAPPATELRVLDADGSQLDVARAHASFSRTLPAELGNVPGPDRDALRFLLIGTPDSALEALQVLALDTRGRPIDVIVNFQTEAAACPDGVAPELVCRQTPPLRLAFDALDRNHPALKLRSLRAELGGALRLSSAGRTLLELPVGGPRATRPEPIERLRAKLRVLVLRARRGGAPALGGTDVRAEQVMREELAGAAAVWAQCGVDFGAIDKVPIQIVDPPASQLLTLGCDLGQPSSGGTLSLQSGRRRVSLQTRPGESPVSVALRLSEALGRSPPMAQVFENQRAEGQALPTADLLLAGPSKWQGVPGKPLSDDPTLPLCLGQVDLGDGLTHFGDGDAFSGTFEERALLRAFDDGDPSSIEVLVVPQFERGERIGESFIVSPGSSLSSSVIVDRSAIAAGARSFALAHELGHVLLAMPGHPDDFGVDQSWSLMDADVADPTIFGPRRLSIADCERMLTQAGPHALTPLLEPLRLRSARHDER